MKYILHTAFNQLSTPQDGKCTEVILTIGEPEWEQTNTGEFNKVIKTETVRFIASNENLRKLSKQFEIVAETHDKEDGEG